MSDTPETLARMFHETYERLAPQFGYQTNMTTRLFNPLSRNGQLMMATCAEMRDKVIDAEITRLRAENEELTRRLEIADELRRSDIAVIGRCEKEREELIAENRLREDRCVVYGRTVEASKSIIDELRAQIAAHEKVCAGVWVKVGERDPKKGLHWTTCVVDWDGSSAQCETWFDGLSWLTSNDARVTHWLDARPPGEE